jgi:tetratricopeptide (TPR) repeat protein
MGATIALSRAIELAPGNANYYDLRGRCRLKLVENGTAETNTVDGALADFTKAIEIVPDFASACYDRGMLLKARMENEQATADFLTVVNHGGDLTLRGQACYNLGELKRQQGDPEQSASYFAQAFFYRGTVEAGRGETVQAIADFDKCIESKSDSPQAYHNRGILKEKSQDLTGALSDFSQAITLAPNFSDAYSDRGTVKAKGGDLAGALADFDQAIALNPNLVSAYINRAIARKQKGDAAGALADQNKAVQLSSGRKNGP